MPPHPAGPTPVAVTPAPDLPPVAMVPPSAEETAPANPPRADYRILPLGEEGRDIQLTLPEATVRSGPHGDIVELAGLDRTGADGAPDLPRFLHSFPIPAGVRVEVEVESAGARDRPGVRVAATPGWKSVTDDGETFRSEPTTAPDPATYAVPDFWPAELATVTQAAVGTQHFARVELNPVQVQPVAGVLRQHASLTARVRFRREAPLKVPSLSLASAPVQGLITNACDCTERKWRPETLWPPMNGAPGDFARRRAGAEVDACIKIRVTRQGLHKLSQAALVSAGVPANSLVGANLRLFFRDREVAVRTSSEGLWGGADHLLFYGEPFLGTHSAESFYWLGFGSGGRRVAQRAAPPIGNGTPEVTSACRKVSEERRLSYNANAAQQLAAFTAQGGFDGWYHKNIYEAGNSTFPPVALTFANTDHFVPGTASVESLIWGMVVLDVQAQTREGNHRILLNGHSGALAAVLTPPKISRTLSQSSFPTSHLNPAGTSSTLTFVANNTPDGFEFDRSLLSFARLTFTREFFAIGNQLLFGGQAGQKDYRVRGFSTADAMIWDVHDSVEPVELTGLQSFPDSTQFGLRFGESLGYEPCYLAATPASAFPILAADITTTPVRPLADPARQADYIILTPAVFAAQAARLLENRDLDGLTVAVAPLEDIYNEFGYGVRDPHAIKQFLGYAFHHWKGGSGQPPRYAALLGDGTFDPRNTLISDPNLFPVHLVATHFISASVDQWYAAVNGADSLADIALGRYPVETLAEMQRMADKVLNQDAAQLSSVPGAWRTGLHLTTGPNVGAGDNFAADTQALINEVVSPDFSATTSTITDNASAATALSAIPSAFNQGRLLAGYMGHGTLDRWTGGLSPVPFDVSVATSLANTILPVVTVFTCSNGLFHEPHIDNAASRKDSLTERLLRGTTGGAVAVVAPTGQALHQVSYPLAREFYNAVLNERFVRAYASGGGYELVPGDGSRIGQALLNGFLAVYLGSSTSARELEIYSIFGDPATRVRAD